MSEESNSKSNHVTIVKRRTMMDAEEYVSIQLSSSEDSIGVLLKKAISATQTKPFWVRQNAIDSPFKEVLSSDHLRIGSEMFYKIRFGHDLCLFKIQ